MGFQAGTVCYRTIAEAAQHARWDMGNNTTMVVDGVPSLLQITPTPDGANTRLQYTLKHVTDWVTLQDVSLEYFPPGCGVNDLTAMDGIELGWLVCGAWIAVYCVMFLARALRGESGGSYGQS